MCSGNDDCAKQPDEGDEWMYPQRERDGGPPLGPPTAATRDAFAYSRQPDLEQLGIPCMVVPVPQPAMRFPMDDGTKVADTFRSRLFTPLKRGV